VRYITHACRQATSEAALVALAERVAAGAALTAAAAAKDQADDAKLAEAKKAVKAEQETRLASAVAGGDGGDDGPALFGAGDVAGAYAAHDSDRTRPKRRR